MKKITIILLSILSAHTLLAQHVNLNLKFKNASTDKVFIQLPVDGTTFYPAREERKIGADSALTINFQATGVSKISVGGFRFLVKPGKNDITIDFAKKGAAAVDFKGTNEAGQLLFTFRKSVFYQDRAQRYLGKDSTVAGLKKLIAIDNQKELKDFDSLFATNKIDKEFYASVKREIDNHYLATSAMIPIIKYFDSQRANKEIQFKQDFKDWWKELYEKHPFDNLLDLATTDYYDHASYYAKYYVNSYLPQQKGSWIKPDYTDVNKVVKMGYDAMTNSFQGKTREYMMASYLFNEMLQKKYQSELVKLLEDFKVQYPKSKYTPYLVPMANEIVAYHQAIKADFSENQTFIKDYSNINTVDDLLKLYKDKIVYVDMWATWCGPCKAEFEFSKPLEDFLLKNKVDMLFVSFDKDAADAQWKEMIKYYKLAGSHIRVNPKLLQDFMTKFWDGKGYSIPRYIIIKNGEIVDKNALRPSSQDKLYDQISGYISTKTK